MTPQLPREQIENLLKLAEGATAGPWTRNRTYQNKDPVCRFSGDTWAVYPKSDPDDVNDSKDSAFIAASHPETIKSLCHEILLLREALEISENTLEFYSRFRERAEASTIGGGKAFDTLVLIKSLREKEK